MDQVPHIHFSLDEFAARKQHVLRELEAKQLDGLLIFRQESMYWLTGCRSRRTWCFHAYDLT